MYYYTVNKIGDGTESNPFRPDYDGAYVWSENQCPTCGRCLIVIPHPNILDVRLIAVTNLEDACQNRNLLQEEVISWIVGDN